MHAAARAGWPIQSTRDNGRGVVYISDHVLRSALARELRRRFVCQPTRIAFTLDGTVLRAVDIDVTGSYGAQLRELGDEIRRAVFDTLREFIGDTGHHGSPIDVTITDIVEGDPLNP